MKKKFGFTVIELMIVIAIVSVLVVLALPSYHNSVRKSRRAEAQSTLTQFAGFAERVFTQSNSYASVSLPAGDNFYTYSWGAPDPPTATAYTIKATPTTVQNKDRCGTMTLTQTGQKTNTGTETDCW